MPISRKMRDFSQQASWIRKMFEEGARLKAEFGADKVFDFSLGNPDLPPPPEFNKVLMEVAADLTPDAHAYMPNGGYPAVREVLASQISSEQGVMLSGHEILMTCGAAGAINVVMKAILDPGDEVIILAPFFVEYKFYVDNHGGVARIVPCAADFSLDLAAIQSGITARTKAVLINSPNNPTGQIYPSGDLEALGRLLSAAGKQHDTTIFLLADEPYRKIVFDGYEVPSILQAYQNSIVVSSYSKDLSLPGERIGYIAVHPEIEGRDDLINVLTMANRILGFVNAPALMQKVVAGLQGVSIDCGIYARRRELLCRVLSTAGYEFMPPKGAFYIFPKSPLTDDAGFVSILQQQRILAVPGRGFGLPGYFRLAFCVDDMVIERSAAGFARAMELSKGKK